MPHVLVVGGGLAGAWAATVAAQRGARVTLVRAAYGATAMSSGALDAVPPSEAGAAEAWLRRLHVDEPRHPYLAAGTAPSLTEIDGEVGALAAALRAGGLTLRVALGAPALVAATTGQVRLAGAVQQTVAAGDLRGRARVAVVGIEGLHGVDARAVAAGIAERVPGLNAVAVRIAWAPWAVGDAGPSGDAAAAGGAADDLSLPALARAIEAPGGAEELGRRLAAAVQATGAPVEVALLPPILGLEDAGSVSLRASGAVGVPLGELLCAPPSPLGWRLQRALDAMVENAGVVVVRARVEGLRMDASGRTVLAARVGDSEVALDALVLAGGRFLGGGLTRAARPREPLAGLPVFVGDAEVGTLARRDLVDRARFRDQPVLRAGLRVDANCRPVDGFGVAPMLNVVACGALLAGLDTTLAAGGLGVAAWTAGRAGRAAATLAAGADLGPDAG